MKKEIELRHRIDAKAEEIAEAKKKDLDYIAEVRATLIDVKTGIMDEIKAFHEEMGKKKPKAFSEIEGLEKRLSIIEKRIRQYREDVTAFDAEKQERHGAIEKQETEIADLQKELSELEEVQKTIHTQNRGYRKMLTRAMQEMTIEEREAFVARPSVKAFLDEVRGAAKEKRALTGGEYVIPQDVLRIVRENLMDYSKLTRHVNLQRVAGTARQPVLGEIPEAVWTEACGQLNEIDLTITQVEVDGYKVAGYIPICNAVLEDDDVGFADAILKALGQSAALAIDKAILYGTGADGKMPQGIVPAVIASAASNKTVIPNTAQDLALWKKIVEAAGKANGRYSRGRAFWAMNEKTYTKLKAAALSVNAAGAMVSEISDTMPIIGGALEVLYFIPDGVIIGGYGELYLLAERAGLKIRKSEHVHFLQDETVFAATARYDGKVVIPQSFAVIGIDGTDPATNQPTFATDAANAPDTLGE